MRDFIARIRRNGLVRDIAGADWNIEIGTLTEAVAFSASPSAMLFDDIPGYAHGQRVATNLYCTEQLQAIALGLPDDVKGIDAVRAWRERSKDIVSIPPRVDRSARTSIAATTSTSPNSRSRSGTNTTAAASSVRATSSSRAIPKSSGSTSRRTARSCTIARRSG
jgi:3-polyprenyl-4-hydroxybenzoate decarboxylase